LIVVGIDPSLSNTAVCIGPDSNFEYGVDLQSFKSEATGRRLVERTRRFEDLVARVMQPIEQSQPIDVVCIEGYSFMSNNGHSHALAEYGGILRFHLVELCEHIYEVPPMTLKKFVAGKAGPGKTMVISALCRDHGVHFRTDDEYDAFGLYRMALVLAGGAEAKSRAQREAIDSVLGLKPSKADRAQKRVERLLQGTVEKPPF
jgi:Holliday junction resolvasome RuvABC endonuclease subunit